MGFGDHKHPQEAQAKWQQDYQNQHGEWRQPQEWAGSLLLTRENAVDFFKQVSADDSETRIFGVDSKTGSPIIAHYPKDGKALKVDDPANLINSHDRNAFAILEEIARSANGLPGKAIRSGTHQAAVQKSREDTSRQIG